MFFSENQSVVSIFTRRYWKESADQIKNVKIMSVAAILMALNLIIANFYIVVGDNLKVYFTFAVRALVAIICGPVVALYYGFIQDILGYIMNPAGAFFPGYTLTSMLSVFIFAIFLYRTRITMVKIFISKLIINLFVNIMLGSLWSNIMYGKAFYYYFAKSLIKNLILLPFEVLVLIAVLQFTLPVIGRYFNLPNQNIKKIPFF